MASFCGVRPNPCSGKQLEERSKDAPSLPPHAEVVKGFFVHNLGMQELPEVSEKGEFGSALIRRALKLEAAERGHVAFSLTVIPQLTNYYNTLHGGAVGAAAEVVAQACVMTVAGDKEFFLGESSFTYLASSKINEQLDVDGYILRQGRNVVVASLEFKAKKTRKLKYVAHLTFYSTASARL
ncbi:unnamed protein product [Spirodela intermedia]|uniref:Thioesterase domain-containing protein n=1 Tax=Spirodela intermedia TaxID=51605 RepID=A0A7I8KSB5_SPIIN|nr:unnamed protein product [Spirodela intermedia]